MTDYERKQNALAKEKRCVGCEYCKKIYAQYDWSFLGCRCEPYRGKWIVEIEKCPKGSAK